MPAESSGHRSALNRWAGSIDTPTLVMTTAITKLPRLWVGYILAVVFLIAEIAVMLKGNLEFLLTTVGLVSWVYWLYCVYKFHDVMERIWLPTPNRF